MSDMKRPDKNSELTDGQVISLADLQAYTRRDFCKSAVGGLAVITLAACGLDDGVDRVSVGEISGTTGPSGDPAGTPGSPDLGRAANVADLSVNNPGEPDLAMSGNHAVEDMAKPVNTAASCNANMVDTGQLPSAVSVGSAVYVRSQGAFICRDASGYYGLSSTCTHQGCTVALSGTELECPCHHAKYTLTGAVISGPNNGPLDHFPVCLTATGTVGMDSNTTVSASQRYQL